MAISELLGESNGEGPFNIPFRDACNMAVDGAVSGTLAAYDPKPYRPNSKLADAAFAKIGVAAGRLSGLGIMERSIGWWSDC